MKFTPLVFLFFIQSVYGAFAQNTVLLEINAPKIKDGLKLKVYEVNPFVRLLGNAQEMEIRNGKVVSPE